MDYTLYGVYSVWGTYSIQTILWSTLYGAFCMEYFVWSILYGVLCMAYSEEPEKWRGREGVREGWRWSVCVCVCCGPHLHSCGLSTVRHLVLHRLVSEWSFTSKKNTVKYFTGVVVGVLSCNSAVLVSNLQHAWRWRTVVASLPSILRISVSDGFSSIFLGHCPPPLPHLLSPATVWGTLTSSICSSSVLPSLISSISSSLPHLLPPVVSSTSHQPLQLLLPLLSPPPFTAASSLFVASSWYFAVRLINLMALCSSLTSFSFSFSSQQRLKVSFPQLCSFHWFIQTFVFVRVCVFVCVCMQ